MYPLPRFSAALPWFRVFLLVYGLIWISLEGALWTVLLMAVLVTGWFVTTILSRWADGRTLTPHFGVAFFVGAGLISANLLFFLTFLLMAVKTGLHAHGPEFSPAEINWVWEQWDYLNLLAGLSGLGIGLFWAGFTPPVLDECDKD